MTGRRILIACIALAALAGCGSGSDTSATSDPDANRYFGDHPGQAETKAAIGAGDCQALGQAVESQTGASLDTAPEPTPPSSRCLLLGRGVRVSIYLDAAYAARQRYYNRIVGQDQFYGTDPPNIRTRSPASATRAPTDTPPAGSPRSAPSTPSAATAG